MSSVEEKGVRGTIDFNLYLISDRKNTTGRDLMAVLEEALAGGVKAVQLRERDLSAKDLYSLANSIRKLTACYGARLIINDRIDIAMAVDADGIHLGLGGLPVTVARRLVGEGKLIGASCHNRDEALTAEEAGADFITFGPVFHTPSKAAYGDPVGINELAAVSRLLQIPVFALGGIKRENYSLAITAGAHGISLISAIMEAAEPRDEARKLLEFLYTNEQKKD